MSLAKLLTIVITLSSRAPTRESFGTPLLLAHHTAWTSDLVREYGSADEMLDDGFDVDDYVYKAALTTQQQNPRPNKLKIARRVTALTQIIDATPTVLTVGFKYKGTVDGFDWNYVVQTGDDATDICTGIAAAVNATAATTTAVGTTKVRFTTDTAGKIVTFDMGLGMDLADATADTTTDDELAAIRVEDDDWYGLNVLDSQSKATALLVGAAIEGASSRKVAVLQTCDSAVLDPNSTTDTFYALKALNYTRTATIYHRKVGEWLAVGWMAGRLTATPGSDTWANKTVVGATVDKLAEGALTAILAKNGNYYTRPRNYDWTFEGTSAQGEYMDTVRFIDWVYSRYCDAFEFVLANNPKVPFTDDGVDLFRAAFAGVNAEGVTAGGYAADPAPTVTAPKVKDVAEDLRANRIMPDFAITARLAGAIHKLMPVNVRIAL